VIQLHAGGATRPPGAFREVEVSAVMTIMAVHFPNERADLLVAAAIFGAIGGVLISLAPSQQLSERVSPNS
jgi:membrane associated rhomboid family serine protease